jgi:uncharacterized membrane protein
MNTLTVCCFATPEAADAALPVMTRLVVDGTAGIDDAAVVSWPPGRRKPSARGLGSVEGPGHLWGGFWGLLLGLIFLTPLAGPTFGAAAGAVAGSLSDFGVEDNFVHDVRAAVTPGTSAVFLVSEAASADRLAAALAAFSMQTLSSRLSPEQEQRLRDALGEESTQPNV